MAKYLALLTLMFILWCGSYKNVNAMESAKIIEVSGSGNSLILDKGAMEGVTLGERGRLLLQTSIDSPELIYVAFGEAVKVSSTTSYWHLKVIEYPELLKRGAVLIFARQSKVLKGRKRLKVRRTKHVLTGGQGASDVIKDKKEGVEQRNLYRDKRYRRRGKNLVDTNKRGEEDLAIDDFTDWLYEGDDGYIEEMEDAVSTDDIRRKDKKENFEKTLYSGVVNINSLDHGLAGQKRAVDRKQEGLFVTTYEEINAKNEKRKTLSPWALQKMKRDGPVWSGDLGDRELRRFLLKSGVVDERKRRDIISAHKASHEIMAKYDMGLTSHATTSDPGYQGTPYSLSLSYEYNLGKIRRFLNSWSLEFGIASGINYYTGGKNSYNNNISEFNVKSAEMVMKAAINFAFINNFSSLNRFIWFAGVGVKNGTAVIESYRLKKKYKYQVRSMPTAQLGMKYRFSGEDDPKKRFKIGVGVNWMVSYDSTALRSSEAVESGLDGVITANDIKSSFGVSFYF